MPELMNFPEQYRVMKRCFAIPILGERIDILYGVVCKTFIGLEFENGRSITQEVLAIVRKLLYEKGELLLQFRGDECLELHPYTPCLN